VRAALARLDLEDGDRCVAIACRWGGEPRHARLTTLADGICRGLAKTVAAADHPLIVFMDGDCGRTLGSILTRECKVPGAVISIDNVQLREFDYIDIGALIPETQVVPVIIKSLLFTASAAT
jgi:ethanolamine utilization protein EutA